MTCTCASHRQHVKVLKSNIIFCVSVVVLRLCSCRPYTFLRTFKIFFTNVCCYFGNVSSLVKPAALAGLIFLLLNLECHLYQYLFMSF